MRKRTFILCSLLALLIQPLQAEKVPEDEAQKPFYSTKNR